MAFENNILFSDLVEKTLIEESQLVAIANKDFMGNIELNGSVKIKSYGDGGTIYDYNELTGLSDVEILTGDTITLNIDKSKAFNFKVGDVEKIKTGNDLTVWADQAFKNMSYAIEEDLFALTIPLTNSGLATKFPEVTVANVVEAIEELIITLDDRKVKGQKFLLISPRLASLLRQKNLTTLASVTLNDKFGPVSIAKYGSNVTIIESTIANFEVGGASMVMGTFDLLNLAVGLNTVQFYRPEKHFTDRVKGLVVYGCKIFNPLKGVRLNYDL